MSQGASSAARASAYASLQTVLEGHPAKQHDEQHGGPASAPRQLFLHRATLDRLTSSDAASSLSAPPLQRPPPATLRFTHSHPFGRNPDEAMEWRRSVRRSQCSQLSAELSSQRRSAADLEAQTGEAQAAGERKAWRARLRAALACGRARTKANGRAGSRAGSANGHAAEQNAHPAPSTWSMAKAVRWALCLSLIAGVIAAILFFVYFHVNAPKHGYA